MMWQVTDTGRVEVRMRADGEQAIRVAKVKADQFIANIVSDLAVSQHVDVVTTELRYSFSKVRPQVTVIWRAMIPASAVATVRSYLDRLNESTQGQLGEVEDGTPDQ